jgi:two-component system response regulator GlrR
VLVVDSNPSQVRTVGLLLRECGYRVLEATSFPDARRLWDAEQPQVLLADVRLEAYNGLHLFIRARAVNPDVTAIITSPVADRVLADETQRLGGTFLVKPVDVDEIVAAIERRVPVRTYAATKASLATLVYREFHDEDAAAPIVPRRDVPRPDRELPGSAHADPTVMHAVRHGRR